MLNKKRMSGLLVIGFSLAAVGSHAATQGVYLGGQVGYGDVHQENGWGGMYNNKDSGVAGRIFAGYKFNRYVAAELGWSKFSNAEFKIPSFYYAYGTLKRTLKTDAVDLVAKGILPVADKVSLYGKVGIAYVNQRVYWTYSGYHDTEQRVLPTVGVGVSYDINPNLAVDMAYNHIQEIGNTSINNIDFVGVGLTYSIC